MISLLHKKSTIVNNNKKELATARSKTVRLHYGLRRLGKDIGMCVRGGTDRHEGGGEEGGGEFKSRRKLF